MHRQPQSSVVDTVTERPALEAVTVLGQSVCHVGVELLATRGVRHDERFSSVVKQVAGVQSTAQRRVIEDNSELMEGWGGGGG